MYNGELDMVPVVLGGGNYSAIAPPNSYIDASKFQSPKALAHHLKVWLSSTCNLKLLGTFNEAYVPQVF